MVPGQVPLPNINPYALLKGVLLWTRSSTGWVQCDVRSWSPPEQWHYSQVYWQYYSVVRKSGGWLHIFKRICLAAMANKCNWAFQVEKKNNGAVDTHTHMARLIYYTQNNECKSKCSPRTCINSLRIHFKAQKWEIYSSRNPHVEAGLHLCLHTSNCRYWFRNLHTHGLF